jgi:hypothetical protein
MGAKYKLSPRWREGLSARLDEGTHATSTIHRRRNARPNLRAQCLGRPSLGADTLVLRRAMVKETKFFRKQAATAERGADRFGPGDIRRSLEYGECLSEPSRGAQE